MQDGDESSGDDHAASFDREDWLKRLRALNPWAEGFDLGRVSDEFKAARKNASLERWQAGSDAWNAWATEMLALKSEADKTAEPSLNMEYSEVATTDFFSHKFQDDAQFSQFYFPGKAWFSGATFAGAARFNKATFASTAGFDGATFADTAWFAGATFAGGAWFGGATFADTAWFDRATIAGAARFNRATFADTAWFDRATFAGGAWFGGAAFTRRTYFLSAQFERSADFDQVMFEGPVTFAEAQFHDEAKFTSIHSEVAFSLARARFARTPDFIEAAFHETPRLDDCRLEPPICESNPFSHLKETADNSFPLDPRPPGLMRCFGLARDEHEHARLRKLRAMAADGKDHENELIFNAFEIAARRFWVDKPWPLNRAGRFWLGWLYGLVSDTGRSMVRPLAAWVITLVLFWGVFFLLTTDREVHRHDGQCHPDYQSTLQPSDIAAAERRMLSGPSGQALALSIRNAMVVDRSEPATSRRMFGCLYGMTGTGTSALPVIPPSVTLLSGLQSIVSAALLFLVGLGVRNMFRLK